MDVSNREQLITVLVFCCSGCLIGMLFDLFRSSRRAIKTNDFFTSVEDIVFWIISGAILIFCITCFTNGELRLYMAIGLVIGGSLYFILISKRLIKIFTGCFKLVARVVSYICIPFNFFYKLIKKD